MALCLTKLATPFLSHYHPPTWTTSTPPSVNQTLSIQGQITTIYRRRLFCVASFQGKKDDDDDEEEEEDDATILLSIRHNGKGFLNESSKKKDFFYRPTGKIKLSISPLFIFIFFTFKCCIDSIPIQDFVLFFTLKKKKKLKRSSIFYLFIFFLLFFLCFKRRKCGAFFFFFFGIEIVASQDCYEVKRES